MVNKLIIINILFLFLFSFSCKSIKKSCLSSKGIDLVFESISPNSLDFSKMDFKIFELKDMLTGISTCSIEINEKFVQIDFDVVKNSKLLSTYSNEVDNLSWKEYKVNFLKNDKLYYFGSSNYKNSIIHFLLNIHTRSFNGEKEKMLFMIVENSFNDLILVVGSCLDQYSDNNVLSTTEYNGSFFTFKHFIDSEMFLCTDYTIDNSGNIQFINN